MITCFYQDKSNVWESVSDLQNLSVVVKTLKQEEILIYVDYPTQGSETGYVFTFNAIDGHLPVNKQFPIVVFSGESVVPFKISVTETCVFPFPLSKSFEFINIDCKLDGDNTSPGDITFYIHWSGVNF